jgi:hypothetical protein
MFQLPGPDALKRVLGEKRLKMEFNENENGQLLIAQ